MLFAGAFFYFGASLLSRETSKTLFAGLTLATGLLGFLFTIPFGATEWLWVTILAGGYYMMTLLVAILYAIVREKA